MKKNNLKIIIMIAGFAIWWHAQPGFSHMTTNSLTAADAVDYFLVTCEETDNDHLYLQIGDLGVEDGRQFNVLAIKGRAIVSVTNPDGKTSKAVRVPGNKGVFHLYVSQTAGGDKAANYQLTYHCEDGDHVHLDTSTTTQMDQP